MLDEGDHLETSTPMIMWVGGWATEIKVAAKFVEIQVLRILL